MKKFVCFVLFALALQLFGEAYKPTYTAYPPVIDGKLDDKCWNTAEVIDKFLLFNDRAKTPAKRKTEVKIVYTDTAVVLGFKAYIPADRLPAADDPITTISSTDCVEFMITPSDSSDSYLHFIVNSFNRTFERTCDQGGFVGNAEWFCYHRSATVKSKDFWTCELEIPYSELGISDPKADCWRFNLVRESYNLPNAEQEISSLTSETNNAGSFKKLMPPTVDFSQYVLNFDIPTCTAEMRDGKQFITAQANVENLSPADRSMIAEVVFRPIEYGMPGRAQAEAELKANQKTQIVMSAAEIRKTGKYQGCFILRDPATSRVMARKYFDLNVDFIPLAIELIDPHYRDAIFYTQKLDKVRGLIKVDSRNAAEIVVSVRQKNSAQTLKTLKFAANKNVKFEFDNSILPYGRLEIYAAVYDKNGNLLAESIKPFRKLEHKPWEMYQGKDGIWYRNGEAIFILGVWNSGPSEKFILPEFNISMEQPQHPDQMRFNRIFTGKNLALMRKLNFCKESAEAFAKLLRRRLDDPDCMIHYLMDEPDCFGQSVDNVSKLAAYLADIDPYRPLLISTASTGGTRYMNCGEINAFHCYPRTDRYKLMANFGKMSILLDHWRAAYDNAKPGFKQSVLWLHQGFCYGDTGLRESRIPTYQEFRNQNLYALAVGAAGILQYNRCEEQFPELYVGLPAVTRELKIVGNEAVIRSTAREKVSVSDKDLRVLAKYNPITGNYWLLAVNGSDKNQNFTINFAPFAGKKIQVLSENRTCEFKNGSLTEKFTPWQAKVFTTDLRDFKLQSIAEVESIIEKEYAKRVKPGNKVYQRYENEGVKVFASSNKYKMQYNECSLWHLADGVTSGTVGDRPHGGGVVVSCDATPGKTPDWIEYEFLKPAKIGRVVVYPAQDSLKDYSIQIERDGKFVTVAEVKDAKGTEQTVTFAPVETKRMRLFVTANRGKNTRLFEIEVYEK